MFHKSILTSILVAAFLQFNFTDTQSQVIGSGSDTLIIDRVIAVVGNKPITQYDLEARYIQEILMSRPDQEGLKCELFEELLINKLLVIQSEIDSIEVSDDEVERQLDTKLQMEILRLGSQENLENMYKKTLLEIKKDLFESAKEQELVRRMYGEITSGVNITPSEVQKYFKKLPEREIPLRPETVELRQIMLKPRISEDERTRIINQLNDYREQILAGKDMETLAVLFSQDFGTSVKGGELGLAARSDLDPAYAAAAFNLKGNEVSRPFKSEFGYHIVQTIERRGDLINTRHILLQPKPSVEEKLSVKLRLDSIATNIRLGKYTFEQAVAAYSQDEQTANNNGILVDADNNKPQIELSKLSPAMLNAIRNMKEGEITGPIESTDNRGNAVYIILMVKARQSAHRADLRTDYDFLQNLALTEKQQGVFDEWVEKTIRTTFHRINPGWEHCEFKHQNWNKN